MKQAKTTKQPLEEDPIQKQADEFGEFWAGNNGSYDDLENNENEKEEFEEEKGKYSFGFYNGFKAALKNPTPIKEGLHTQGEWKVGKKYTSRFKEYLPILCAEPSFAATIAVVHPINNKLKEEDYANAELIVKAVNNYQKLLKGDFLKQARENRTKELDERKALLDSHGKLLELVEIMEKDFNGLYHQKRLNEEGLQVREKIKTAINNAKNIKQ